MKTFRYVLIVLAFLLPSCAWAQVSQASAVLHTQTVAMGIEWPCDATGVAGSNPPHSQAVSVPSNAQIVEVDVEADSPATWQDSWVSTSTDVMCDSHKVGTRGWNLQGDSPPKFCRFSPDYYAVPDGLVFIGGWCSNDQPTVGAAAASDVDLVSANVKYVCPNNQCAPISPAKNLARFHPPTAAWHHPTAKPQPLSKKLDLDKMLASSSGPAICDRKEAHE
jgi:hypothetical protein